MNEGFCNLVQMILHSLQKSIEKRPLDVDEVAAAAEASIAKPNVARVMYFAILVFISISYVYCLVGE